MAYQCWLRQRDGRPTRRAPYLLALAFVLVDHAAMGMLAPGGVYDDAFSLGNPWLAAVVHGGYVLATASFAALAWTWAERERRAAEARAYVSGTSVAGICRPTSPPSCGALTSSTG